MQTYKDLIVWQKSIKLTVEIYRLTALFPSEEKFGITSQMRRCVISIPSNVAEGFGRRGKKENAQFINIAYGSATELETQIIIAKQLPKMKHLDYNNFQYDTIDYIYRKGRNKRDEAGRREQQLHTWAVYS